MRSPLRTTRLLLALAVVGAYTVVVAPVSASAGHPHNPWYQSRWGFEGDEQRIIPWRFDNGYPTGSLWRNRAIEAANTWTNAINPGYPNFDFQEGVADYSTLDYALTNCGVYQQNIVGVDALTDPSHSAGTRMCRYTATGRMYSFRLAIDSDRIPSDPAVSGSFYEGTATSWSGSRPDLLGILTHEFGHATGRVNISGTEDGHFEETDPNMACPGGASVESEADSTMCTALIRNSIKWRTLTSHDVSALEDVQGYGS